MPRGLAHFVLLVSVLLSAVVSAGEMRSVLTDAAVLFDAPSVKSKKLYLVRKQTPLEVLVSLDGMSKVRDAEGTIAWIDKSVLSDVRTVVVIAAQADIRQSPALSAPVLASAEKWLALTLLELPVNGWAKVRHQDGVVGFVRQNQVWGI